MQSRRENRYYIVQEHEEDPPVKIAAKKTDETLAKLERQVEALRKTVQQLYETNFNLYHLVQKEIFDEACLDVDEGKVWRLDNLLYETQRLQKRLKENDDDISVFQFQNNRAMTLYDLGFERNWGAANWLEKDLEDSDEKEVVEEIQFKDIEHPLRRRRTTYWEKTDYGKTSKEIKYQKLRIGKRLQTIINNTAQLEKKS